MANIAVITRNAVEIIAAIILIRTFFSDFKKWSLTVSDFTKWGTFDPDLSWLPVRFDICCNDLYGLQ